MAKFGGFSVSGVTSKLTSKVTSSIDMNSLMSGNMDPSSFSAESLIGQTAVGSKLIDAKNKAMDSKLGQAISSAKSKIESSEVYGKANKFLDDAMNSPQVVKLKEAGSSAATGLMKQVTGIDMGAVKSGDISSMENIGEIQTPSVSDLANNIPDPKSFMPNDILGKVGK